MLPMSFDPQSTASILVLLCYNCGDLATRGAKVRVGSSRYSTKTSGPRKFADSLHENTLR
jgi:hypothetical protein